MAATVVVHERNGTAGAGTVKGTATNNSVRFKNADTTLSTDTANPVTVPTAGNAWSFKKSLQLNVTAAGTPAYSTLDNLKCYFDGALAWTGCLVQGKTAATYAQAAAAPTATPTGVVDAFGWTSGAPKAITGSRTTGTGYLGNLVELYLRVGTTATAGTKADETLTFSYDEV